MKLKRLSQILAVDVCAVMLSSALGTISVWANSAQTYWEGADSAGAVITDENCPIVVEHELLTFDISDFPQNDYGSEEECLDYSAKVTAQYTFYNPADYTVTAKLVFPFGNLPSYVGV